MTRAEFDVWIEQHYTDLLKVARRRTNSDDDALDAVQTGIAAMLGSPQLERITPSLAWPQAVKFVTGAAYNDRVSAARKSALKREAKNISRTAAGFHGWKRPAPRAE